MGKVLKGSWFDSFIGPIMYRTRAAAILSKIKSRAKKLDPRLRANTPGGPCCDRVANVNQPPDRKEPR